MNLEFVDTRRAGPGGRVLLQEIVVFRVELRLRGPEAVRPDDGRPADLRAGGEGHLELRRL